MAFTLSDLDARLAGRAGAPPQTSYTAALLRAGVDACAQKLGEEAVEAAIAAVKGDKKQLTNEAADLIYHLLVTLRAAGVGLNDVMAELERRTAQSGLTEKASRTGQQNK